VPDTYVFTFARSRAGISQMPPDVAEPPQIASADNIPHPG